MSKYQTMPNVVHGGTIPAVHPAVWLSTVEELLGRRLGKVDRIYAIALSEHHNWTATAVADHLRLVDAAPDMLHACRGLLALAEVYSPERAAENEIIAAAKAAITKAGKETT